MPCDGGAGEQVAHGRAGLLGGAGPVFGAHPRTAGHVTRGDDLRHGRHTARVAHHPVAQAQSGAGQRPATGRTPTPTITRSASSSRPPASSTARTRPAPSSLSPLKPVPHSSRTP